MGNGGKLAGGSMAWPTIIMTGRNQDTGEVRTVIGMGERSKRAAARDAVAQLERTPGRWVVECISSPQAIYDDLQVRMPNAGAQHSWPVRPEYGVLASIGRNDLAPLRSDEERHPQQRARKRSVAKVAEAP